MTTAFEAYQKRLEHIGEAHGILNIIGVFSRYSRAMNFYAVCQCRPKVKQVMTYSSIIKQRMCDTCYAKFKHGRDKVLRLTVAEKAAQETNDVIDYVEKRQRRKNRLPNTRYDPKRGGAYEFVYLFEHLVTPYKERCKERGREYAITDEEFLYLIKQSCHYCGIFPNKIKMYKGGEFRHLGVDRVHNQFGYFYLNCVSCCWDCNMAKGATSYAEFTAYLDRIAAYRSRK